MNKRIVSVFILFVSIPLAIFAFNPSNGGEDLYQFASPELLTDGASVAGGALPYTNAAHIAINPALTATEQRIVVDFSLTGLIADEGDSKVGFAGHLGAIVPSKYGVFTGSLYCISSKVDYFDFGTNFVTRAGFAKDISDELSVGADVAVGFGSAISANLDLGFTYGIGKIKWLPFLKDIRLGAAITSIGYGYNPTTTSSLYNDKKTSAFPSPFTPHFGIAGTLLSAEKIKLGMSLDMSFPTFQNFVMNTGLQVAFMDIVRLKIGHELNVREIAAKTASLIPSVSLSVKIGVNTKDDSFLAKQGWQQSEIVPSVGYKNLYNDVHAASVGFTAHLGLKDTSAPEINLW